MICPICHFAVDQDSSGPPSKSCPNCQVVFSDLEPPKPVERTPRRGLLALLVLLLVAGVVGLKVGRQKRPRVQPAGTSVQSTEHLVIIDPCELKQNCVIFYTTPWCVICEASLPAALEINRQWAKEGSAGLNGLRILVGHDKPEKSLTFAAKIGPIATVDNGDTFSNQFRITSYPTWIVLDAKGQEVSRVGGGIDQSQVKQFIHDSLKL